MYCNIIYQYLPIYLRRSTASCLAIYLCALNINPQCVIVNNDISEEPCDAQSLSLGLEGKSCL